MSESQPPRHSKPKMKAAKTPHLQVRTVEGLLFEEAIAITGNARALLQLRDRIDRALENETSHPFEEAGYRDVNGIEFEVAVKRAKSREEMREPVPKPESRRGCHGERRPGARPRTNVPAKMRPGRIPAREPRAVNSRASMALLYRR